MVEAARKVALERGAANIAADRFAERLVRLLKLTDLESPPAKRPPAKAPRGKRIVDHTAEELEAAIAEAVTHCTEHGLQFFKILHGIDAYMERRRRQGPGGLIGLGGVSDHADVWGNS